MPYYRAQTRTSLSRPVRAVAQPVTVPASVGGVNALDPAIATPPQDCLYTFNLMPSEYGLRLRKGYREWATGIGAAGDADVRTVIPFEGVDPANNKLFVACLDGIYDVSTDGTTSPTRVYEFTTKSGNAGYCTWTEFTTDAPETYLFVADAENGIVQYDESTGTWAVPSFTGPTLADIDFVTLHKQRLWVIEKNSARAYYSDVASIAGTLTAFTFGSKFTYGGNLMGLYTWTLDGGDGVDDYLVAVGRGGDVLAYRGEDPALSSWTLTGSYFIGEVPKSRRLAVPYGGELFLLSTFGITSLSDLVRGVDSASNPRSPSAKINRILRPQVIALSDEPGWQLTSNPADGFLQIVEPFTSANSAIQYVQNLLTRSWGFWRNVPMLCADTWQGEYYLGAESGILWVYDGTLDNTTLTAEGDPIDFDVLTSFQAYGEHGVHKQVGQMRAVTLEEPGALYNIKAVYDYELNPAVQNPFGVAASDAATWDFGTWGAAIWSGESTGGSFLEGAAGLGRTIAIAMRGSAQQRLTVLGWDMTLVTGGFL